MKELSSHLSSLENNVSALAGLGDLVDMTKAKLDDVMYRHLLEDEYAVITDD